MKKKIILCTISFIVALAMVLLVCGLRGILTEKKDALTELTAVCDAFFVAGAIFFCFGGLAWASDKGAFDGLGYSFSSFFNVHKPAGKGLNWQKKETYQEYVERKHQPEKQKTQPAMLVIGAVFIIVAVILLIVIKLCTA